MKNKRFKPLVDKLFWIILIPTAVIMAGATVMSVFYPVTLFLMVLVDLLVAYCLLSSLFGYVELRERSLLIKYGFFLKKEIPYEKIRDVKKERKWYSESMMALKNSLEHVNIRYNTFDVTTVSVVGNDDFIEEIQRRLIKNNEAL